MDTCPEDGTSLRHDGGHDRSTEVFADDAITETAKPDSFSGQDYTTVDVDAPNTARRGLGDATAISMPFAGATPFAATGPISSGEITAQTARAIESAPPPTAEPASNPDPTTSTKLDPGFVHLVPGTLVDAYEVEKLLGAGGMGAVYCAHHERLGRRVAIKVISPNLSRDRDAVERFEQESHALARISHPNIVGVLGVGTLPGDGRSYYVMEYLEGEGLQARLDRSALGLGLALDVIDQIARGLEAAHAAGIVHRDLKADNVWLQHVGNEPRPTVKILDFGLSKLVQHRRTEHTATNVMFGTAAYMSPEQCRSSRDVGPPTDVYALGCLSYELLCGQLPFTYDNIAELVAAHYGEDAPRPLSLNPSIAPALDELLTAMLAKDPIRRPTLARVRSVVASTLASPTSAAQSRPPKIAAQPRSPAAAQPRAPTHAARARRASTVLVGEKYPSRRVFVALAGLVVLGVVIAAVVGSGGASHGKPAPVIEEPRTAIEIDASAAPVAAPSFAPVAAPSVAPVAAPSVTLDASVPTVTPTQRMDASMVTPRPNVDPVSPSIAPLLDGGVEEPAVVVEPDALPAAVDPSTIDTSGEPVDANAIEIDTPVQRATTSPPAHRTPPVPTAKRPPKRNVIANPFKNKQVTK